VHWVGPQAKQKIIIGAVPDEARMRRGGLLGRLTGKGGSSARCKSREGSSKPERGKNISGKKVKKNNTSWWGGRSNAQRKKSSQRRFKSGEKAIEHKGMKIHRRA